jgi:hypothetical protein
MLLGWRPLDNSFFLRKKNKSIISEGLASSSLHSKASCVTSVLLINKSAVSVRVKGGYDWICGATRP